MADATQSQMDKAAQSQTDNKHGQSQADNAGTQTEAGKVETFDRAYVESLRSESAKYRTELKTVRDELQTIKDGQLSEIDKAKKEANEAGAKTAKLEADLRSARVRAEIAIHAVGLQIVDADAAHKLLDESAINFDDEGKPTNVKTLLNHLVKDKTFLVAQSTVTTKPNNPGRTGAALTKEQIKSMSPAEINANWDAVQQTLAAG